MPLIEVWHYPGTDKFFKDKLSYRDYLKKVARIRMRQRRIEQAIENRDAILYRAWEETTSIQGIVDWLYDNPDFLTSLVTGGEELVDPLKYHKQSKRKQERPNFRFYGLELSVRYTDVASNSHSCPHNGKRNWSRKPDITKGYPGYVGNIRIWYNVEPGTTPFGVTGALKRAGVHTGSGGGHTVKHDVFGYIENRSWDVILWLDDWVGLRKGMLFDKVKNGDFHSLTHGLRYDESL